MATNNPQILLTLTEQLLSKIDKFKEEENFLSRAEAVRQLIQAGLERKAEQKSKQAFNKK